MQEIDEVTMRFTAKDNSASAKWRQKRSRNRWMAVLTFTSIGGIVTGLTGLLLSGLSLFGLIDVASRLHGISTVLIITAFVSLSLAAHALDKLADLKR